MFLFWTSENEFNSLYAQWGRYTTHKHWCLDTICLIVYTINKLFGTTWHYLALLGITWHYLALLLSITCKQKSSRTLDWKKPFSRRPLYNRLLEHSAVLSVLLLRQWSTDTHELLVDFRLPFKMRVLLNCNFVCENLVKRDSRVCQYLCVQVYYMIHYAYRLKGEFQIPLLNE